MQQDSSHFSVGDRVRFVHCAKREPLETVVVGEVAGINPEVATVDVMAVLDGRPTFVTKRPWDLEKILGDAEADGQSVRTIAERRKALPPASINRS